MPIAHNMTMAVHPVLFPGTWLRFKARDGDWRRTSSATSASRPTAPTRPAAASPAATSRRSAFARWLATKPKLLILDEPTQGVDVGAKSEIHKIIRSLAKEGLAVLMISSDLPEVLGMSDRIARDARRYGDRRTSRATPMPTR